MAARIKTIPTIRTIILFVVITVAIAQMGVITTDVIQQDLIKDTVEKDITDKDITDKDVTEKDITDKDVTVTHVTEKDITKKDVTETDVTDKDVTEKDITETDVIEKDGRKKNTGHVLVNKSDSERVDEIRISTKDNVQELFIKSITGNRIAENKGDLEIVQGTRQEFLKKVVGQGREEGNLNSQILAVELEGVEGVEGSSPTLNRKDKRKTTSKKLIDQSNFSQIDTLIISTSTSTPEEMTTTNRSTSLQHIADEDTHLFIKPVRRSLKVIRETTDHSSKVQFSNNTKSTVLAKEDLQTDNMGITERADIKKDLKYNSRSDITNGNFTFTGSVLDGNPEDFFIQGINGGVYEDVNNLKETSRNGDNSQGELYNEGTTEIPIVTKNEEVVTTVGDIISPQGKGGSGGNVNIKGSSEITTEINSELIGETISEVKSIRDKGETTLDNSGIKREKSEASLMDKSGIKREKSELTRDKSELTRDKSDLTRDKSDLTRDKSELTKEINERSTYKNEMVALPTVLAKKMLSSENNNSTASESNDLVGINNEETKKQQQGIIYDTNNGSSISLPININIDQANTIITNQSSSKNINQSISKNMNQSISKNTDQSNSKTTNPANSNDPNQPDITKNNQYLNSSTNQEVIINIEPPVNSTVNKENNSLGNSNLTTPKTTPTTDILLTTTPTVSAPIVKTGHQLEFPWPVKREAVVEGDLILGGLMMVHEREDSVTCGPVMPQGGVQALEAMLYTLDVVNSGVVVVVAGHHHHHDPGATVTRHQRILPNISLGAHILDDCDKDTYGLEMAVDFIKGSISNIDGAEYSCNKTQVRKVISGVVGAASSVTSIQVANLLRLFKIPQVSFFSTSPELSNKQRFEFFTRTIPSDLYQVKAMVDIIMTMGWSYVSIIYEESNYGIKAFEELEELLAVYNICIAVKEKLVKDSGVADDSAYDNIVLKLLTKPMARGCIIFGSDQEVAGVMKAVRRCNATGSFSWVGSDGWSGRSLVHDGNEPEVEGTLSVQPQANAVRGFKEYFLGLNVENNRRNPWFVEFWEDHFHCKYPNSSRTPYNQNYTKQCSGKEKLTKNDTVFEDQLQFVSDAVMAFAYAIKAMHNELCHGVQGLCDAMKPTKGSELLKYLKKVNFTGLSGDQFQFDINGDAPARYNIIHFKQISSGNYKWVKVGEYLDGKLILNMTEVQFKLGHPKTPESVCSFPCDLGQAKKYVEGESCCWHCFNCTQYQIRHPTDPTQCITCPRGTLPDPLHVHCDPLAEEFLRPDSGWAIGAMTLSTTGVLVTLFVCGVFVRHNDTPVVRASGRELTYVLLAGILMCYCVTYALVLRPSDIVCGLQRFGAGFCFTVVYAALLTKTNRISRIFNAGKHSAKRPSFISPRSQLIICSGLVGVQLLINGVWMIISPARAIYHYPTRDDNLLVCSSYIDASYMIAFSYPILLIIICTVYAVLTRKIPEAFNESKHIGFTMYTTCVIWLAFVPLYFGTANHVALRITSMSVTISLSASVTVVCLFSPKLYIILIRPERNIRQSMMPMRYSAINKNNTGTSGTGGTGTMMAAVMVTAATCNQNEKIQKHVDILENEESDTQRHSATVITKDSSTQTSSSQLDIRDVDLDRLHRNNNCSNGPVAVAPLLSTTLVTANNNCQVVVVPPLSTTTTTAAALVKDNNTTVSLTTSVNNNNSAATATFL